MKIPEFRVTSKGPMIRRVVWDSLHAGEPAFDLTEMKVMEITRVVIPGDLPVVKITFVGRLVEVEESEG